MSAIRYRRRRGAPFPDSGGERHGRGLSRRNEFEEAGGVRAKSEARPTARSDLVEPRVRDVEPGSHRQIIRAAEGHLVGSTAPGLHRQRRACPAIAARDSINRNVEEFAIGPRGAHGGREPDHVNEEDTRLGDRAVIVEEDDRLALHLRDVAQNRLGGKLDREALIGNRERLPLCRRAGVGDAAARATATIRGFHAQHNPLVPGATAGPSFQQANGRDEKTGFPRARE